MPGDRRERSLCPLDGPPGSETQGAPPEHPGPSRPGRGSNSPEDWLLSRHQPHWECFWGAVLRPALLGAALVAGCRYLSGCLKGVRGKLVACQRSSVATHITAARRLSWCDEAVGRVATSPARGPARCRASPRGNARPPRGTLAAAQGPGLGELTHTGPAGRPTSSCRLCPFCPLSVPLLGVHRARGRQKRTQSSSWGPTG